MEYIVNTPCGKVRGVNSKENGIIAFKGIRYAYAERFDYPKQVKSWEGIYDASSYGACSYQPRSFYNEEEVPKKAFYFNEFRKGESYTYSEDCLFLNIFTPDVINVNSNLPVIIYIHGGGYKGGCGHEKHFDVPVWPKKGVIAVTINYRLGPLGFLVLEELKDKNGCVGNYGLYDQLTAIKWVKENISSFGGDPNNITIMGQSAGAMSVQQLSLSPLSKGLFQKAIMSSGGGINKILKTPKPEKNFAFWSKVKELCKATTIEEFKKVPVEDIFKAWDEAKKIVKGSMMPASPVIDGRLIVDSEEEIVKRNDQMQIPYMIGSNSEDLMSPFMHSMATRWCFLQTIPSYCYMFNQQLPGDNNGAWHSSDLWYFFGTHRSSWRPMTTGDDKLSDQMISYICNFAKTGDPNGEDLPKWLPTNKKTKEVMHFGSNESKMKKVKKSKLWINLFTKKAVGE